MAVSETEERDIASSLSRHSTSMLSDATGGKGVLAPGLLRYAGAGTAAGRAITAQCAEGSLQAVFAALEHARPGDMLCTVGPGNSAYLGDILATNLVRHGLVGVVIDGFIRDREAISQMPLSCHARGLFPVNQRRLEPGSPMVAVIIGGITINPGDWVVADDDGVIVIPPDEVDQALDKAGTNTLVERRVKELLAEGVKVNDAVRRAVGEIQAQGRQGAPQ